MKDAVSLEFLAGILESLGTIMTGNLLCSEESIVPFATLNSLEKRGELPHHWAEKIFATTFKLLPNKKIEVRDPGYMDEEPRVLMSFDYSLFAGVPLKVIAYAVLNYIKIVYYGE